MSVRRSDQRVLHIEGEIRPERSDILAVEKPLEIRVPGVPLTVTMRTPGNDFELVAGFLVAGGLVGRSAAVRRITELARETGMTVVGFLRGDAMNVYAGAHRTG